MNQFLSEIQEKYMEIIKSANLIVFLNWLAKTSNLADKSTPWQKYPTSIMFGHAKAADVVTEIMQALYTVINDSETV